MNSPTHHLRGLNRDIPVRHGWECRRDTKIAKTAFALNVGARGLRRMMEKILEDYIYCIDDYAQQKIEITDHIVFSKLNRKIAL